MSIRRERDARRVAKSVRTHEATMDAYSNATGWNRISGKAWDKAWGRDGSRGPAEDIFPSAEKGNRSTGNLISPKSTNPRSNIEMEAVANDPSEKSRLGHTLGKGHIATTDSDGNAIRKAHTDTHKGHYWKPGKGSKDSQNMAKSKCTGCGATSMEHYKDLNNFQVGWK